MSDQTSPPTPAPPKAKTTTDDVAAAEYRWACQLHQQLGEVRTIGNRWFVYNRSTGCWNESEHHLFRRMAMDIIPANRKQDRLARGVVANLESRMQVAETTFHGAIRFEATNVVLINTRKGVVRVDPTSIRIHPHSSSFNFTCSLNVTYNPEAKCPLFDRVVVQSLPDEQDQMLLLNFFGYTLLPDVRFQLALVCHGVSGSGKSTVVEPLVALFEHEALLTAFPIESICTGKDYCLTHFQHAVVNICGELSSMEVTESANFKSIVAGDVLQSRGIYDKAARLRSICKLIFLANNPPRFRNGTSAESRRLAILHFSKVPAVVDNTLRPTLRSEVEGVFNVMLSRLQALLSMATMPTGGASSRSIKEAFSLANAPIETFVERHCELGPDHTTPRSDVQEAFANFVHTHDLHTGYTKGFIKRLKEKFACVQNYRPRAETGPRPLCLRGIGLRANVAELEKATFDYADAS